MNIIGIDQSIASTGLTINGELFNYTKNAFTKTGNLSKWYRIAEQYVTYRHITYNIDKTSFTSSELTKNLEYDKVINMMMKDIMDNIDPNEPIKVGIEGYSYGSEGNALIDLVTFGTKLRDKLLSISDDITILPPTSLKRVSCEMTYKPDGKGTYRNSEGLSGGKFTKREMYKSLTENIGLSDRWIDHLRSIESEVMEGKNIQKPYDDLNDSYLLYLHLLGS